MRDRALYFYANINKCDSDCKYYDIDYSNAKFICECKFKTMSDSNSIENTKIVLQPNNKFPERKSSVNIEVFQCLNEAFNKKYFKNSIMSIILVIFTASQIACMILYFILGIPKITKHAYSLFESFKNFSKNNNIIEANPPKRPIINSKLKLKKELIKENKNRISNKKSEKSEKSEKPAENKNSKKKFIIDIKEPSETEVNKINNYGTGRTSEKESEIIEKNGNIENKEMYMKLINEYINPEFDENDFDDVIDKDKRTFLQFFLEKIYKNQIFIKTFLIDHIFKPLVLKIMLLILIIELYFLITALFYTEDYISDLFYSDEKDGFLSFMSRRAYEIIYTMMIMGIIGYFCSYFFDSDEYLRRLFTKKIQANLNSALNDFVKMIKLKFIILIVISIIISIFSFVYIACFNVVYPYLKNEWIKSSIITFLLMQIVNLLSTFLGTCCRYLSIRWNNIKLFRLSLNLD
jgi:hypothetical protein